MPMFFRMPRFPKFNEKPLPPSELEMPPLLRFIFQPGAILNVLRNRNGMAYLLSSYPMNGIDQAQQEVAVSCSQVFKGLDARRH
jgi:hypothetical protein